MSMLTYLAAFLGGFMAPKVLAALGAVLGLVLVDFLLGVFVALKQRKFQFSKLAQFVQTGLIPYVGGLLILALFSNSNAELAALFFTIATTITVKFIADIGTKVGQLFSGISINIQSPIDVEHKSTPAPAPQPVSPQTPAVTNTPAAAKVLPDEPKDEPIAQ